MTIQSDGEFDSLINEKLMDIENILNYLHTYPAVLSKLDFHNLICGSEIYDSYKAWLKLYESFDLNEAEFFSRHLVPITKDDYSFFVDISTPMLSIIEFHVDLFDMRKYFKTIYFTHINDLLYICESESKAYECSERYKDLTSLFPLG